MWSGRGYFAAAGCQSGRWLPLVFTIYLPRRISGLELSLLKRPLPICDSQIGCRALYGCALVPTLQGDYPMKKFLLTGVALAALASGSALAADLPARRGMPVKAPEPVSYGYNWSGFYIGAHGGGGWSDHCFTFAGGGEGCHDANGWLGGGQIGFNMQAGPVRVRCRVLRKLGGHQRQPHVAAGIRATPTARTSTRSCCSPAASV